MLSQKDKNLFEKKGHPCNGTEPCDFMLELLVQVENKSKWNSITHIPLVNAEQRAMSVKMEILFVTFCSHGVAIMVNVHVVVRLLLWKQMSTIDLSDFFFLVIIIYVDLHLGCIKHIYKPDGHNN